VAGLCRARRRGTVHLRPRPAPRRRVPTHEYAVAVIVAEDGRMLLERRPDRGLLARMWCFPSAPVGTAAHAGRAAAEVAGTRGEASNTVFAGTVVHTFTHRREVYRVFRIEVGIAEGPDVPDRVWAARIDDYPMPAAHRRIARLAAALAVSFGPAHLATAMHSTSTAAPSARPSAPNALRTGR
jgi:A/G-specific adenine glycosylase